MALNDGVATRGTGVLQYSFRRKKSGGMKGNRAAKGKNRSLYSFRRTGINAIVSTHMYHRTRIIAHVEPKSRSETTESLQGWGV